MTLAGEAPQVGQPAPGFTLHRFEDGMHPVTLADLTGKAVLLSVVPSLDTPVCAQQTREFNQKLAAMGDKVQAFTVSLDLPFAQNRFCGAEGISSMQSLSDYQERAFAQDWGMMIEELKILARGVFIVDSNGNLAYAELVTEVTEEPNYDAALAALNELI